MHVTAAEKPLGQGGKFFSTRRLFRLHTAHFHTQLTLQQFCDDDADESEELTLELCKCGEGGDCELTLELRECGEGGDAGDMAGVWAGRHVTKRG